MSYRTGGKQKAFAELMGWTPQYLAKLLRGSNFGLAPVVRLVEVLPEIDARWLLTGEGSMFSPQSHFGVLLDMQRYLPVMTEEELSKTAEFVSPLEKGLFSTEFRVLLEKRLVDRFAVADAAYCTKTSK